MTGKPFTLTRRGKIFYARFKLPNNTWSTAKSTHETARGRAERWALDYLQGGQVVRHENVTLADFAKDFFSYESEWSVDRRVSGKRNTARQCKEKTANLQNHILPAFGKMKLTQIDKVMIKTFRNDLFKNGLSGSSINHILSCLKAILEQAEEKGLIQAIPKFERAADNTKHRGILTLDEVRRLFDLQWPDYRAYVANLTAACTGLRRGELMALTLQEIHGDYITVAHSWDDRLRTVNPTTKTGRSRTIILPARVKHEIERLIEVNPYKKPESFLFFSTTMETKPCEGVIITKGFLRALKKIGITEKERQQRNITFHSWRHWFNSLLINAKVPIQKIQAMTGHLTAEMTQHYYHVDELGDVVNAVDVALFSAKAGKR